MGRHAKKVEEEEGGESAPLWMISFADMMSLLMAFFVMLSTFSNFGPAETNKLMEAVDVMLSPVPNSGLFLNPSKMEGGPAAVANGQLQRGSERLTQDQFQGKGMMAEGRIPGYKARKVFLADSRKVFWGNGVVLSGDGRSLIEALAAFATAVPDRIVIAENGPGGDIELGLRRAVSVVDYLTAHGISRGRCNIGARGMVPEEEFTDGRVLEIVLLDESLYK